MVWLCIDAGTSVIKAVLLDDSGRQLAIAREKASVSHSQYGCAEQSMKDVWQAVVKASRAALRDNVSAITGIVFTAQGDGVWLVDTDGEAVTPAILWNDSRAHEVVDRFHSSGVVESAFRICGSVTYPGLPSAILPWLAQHEPETLDRARWLLTCSGWLYLCLTGEITVDLSDASNPFCNMITRQYDPKLLEHYGVSEYCHLLPPIHPSFAPVSALQDTAAHQLGVAAGLPVIMAPYDIVATAAGCGSVIPGEGCLILGTTISAEVVVEDPGIDRTPAGTTIALPDGVFLRAMPTLTGCEALDWARSLLQVENLDGLSALAASSAIGAENLVFFPYLSPAGERSPFLSPDAKGSFLGLSLLHTREHLSRAVFEGLSFSIRECLHAASVAPLSSLAVCGGGSRSDFWCQMIADVCNCSVFRPTMAEVGAHGAFLYAQLATGAVGSLKSAIAAAPQDGRNFAPSRDSQVIYDELFHRFLLLRRSVAETWKVMRPHKDGLGLERSS